MQEINIVELIENSPITRLSNAYNNKLLTKIKESFTGFEQQLFVSSFYCYLNYDKNSDFVVDLDAVWKWLGFNQKYNAERLLEKHFNLNFDYKSAPHFGGPILGEQKLNMMVKETILKPVKINGGQNIKKIYLTIKCFKSLCLKAQTKKASEIHEYYMKMEEFLYDVVEEETDELRKQLAQKDNIILEIKETIEDEKSKNLKAIEEAIIAQFPLNTECIYIGTIDNTNEANEKLIKFGHTNNLEFRVKDHRKTYDNFILINAFRVQNKVEIEGLIKTSVKIKRQIRHIEINGKFKLEIIAYDLTIFTIEKLTTYIKEIINSKIYSIDNFNKLIKENEELEDKNRELQTKNSELENELEELKSSLSSKTLNKSISAVTNAENQFVYTNETISDDLLDKFNEFIDTMSIVRYDVNESSVNMESYFRIWLKQKPTKIVFHKFKEYLDGRFKAIRFLLDNTEGKSQYVHGYNGVKLIPIDYKKKFVGNAVETFLFQSCIFSPSAKILTSILIDEYNNWNNKIHKETTDSDIKELKEYLNESEYFIKSVVWTEYGSSDGYYGLSLKNKEYVKKITTVSGKKVEKVELKSGLVLETWNSIEKAALGEKISNSKMSRSIKNNTIFTDYFYRVKPII
jgi:cell division septum initiation protein DivIVA